MKRILFFAFCMLMTGLAFGQGTETFANIPTNSPSSYDTRNWTGDDGSAWTATFSRTSESINGKAILMNDDVANAYVESGSIAGGIGDLTITTQLKFSGGSGSLNVSVNGSNVGTIPYSSAAQATTISGINVSGNVVIRVSNNIGGSSNGGADRVAIDDVTWTGFAASTPNVGFDASTSNETETDATFNVDIPVTLANYDTDVDLSVTVTGGTAESGDYTLNTASLSFTGNGTQNISVSINDDADDEIETVELTIVETTSTGIALNTSIHVLTIIDDEVPQVLIAEVADPSDVANARFVALENRGAVSVDISGWKLNKYTNANVTSLSVSIPASTTLAPGEFFVISKTLVDFNNAYGVVADLANGSVVDANGDDTYELTNSSDISIDIYGVIGTDGSGEVWEYENDFVTRNSGITNSNSTLDISEWTINASFDVADIIVASNAIQAKIALLPVELMNFTATPNQKSIDLVWETATEENNAFFAIERSANGIDFEEIAMVEGAGTTYETQTYNYSDVSATNGINYYRLRQVDFNGGFEYHKVVNAILTGDAIDVLVVPTQVNNQFDVVFGEATSEATQMDIFTIDGKLVKSETVNTNSNRQTIDVTNFQSGLYIIRMNMNNTIVTKRFVKL